jgi:hypothetical protein
MEANTVAPQGRAPQLHVVPVGGFDQLTHGAQQFGAGLGKTVEAAANDYEQ